MKKKVDIEEAIKNIRYDLKAEVILADLMSNGLESDDFVVIPNGTFKRRYSRDIAYVTPMKLQNGQVPAGIYVNRDAIYDTLPEGLFHEKTETSEPKSASKGSKKLKAEEKAARNFFLPFENELFSQKINLELEERKILLSFSENLFDDLNSDFWNFDPSTNRNYLSRMAKFLHFSHKITGNISLTEKCLSAILNETVDAVLVDSRTNIKEDWKEGEKTGCKLGHASLGVDFVCGESFYANSHFLHFTIGPLKNTRITDYLENETVSTFLKCFAGYFVPAEMEVVSTVIVEPGNYDFMLDNSGDNSVLGYTTILK